MNINGHFSLISVTEGTTLNGYLRVEGTPLVQRYTKGTDNYIPNFEKLADGEKPTVVPVIRNITTGALYAPSTYIWKYNGFDIHFGSDGLSTDEGYKGFFKKITVTVTSGDKSVQVQGLRVMKNLVLVSGYDNDRISLSGTVKFDNNVTPFSEMSKEVVIQETTGNAYDVLIKDNKSGALEAKGDSLTCTAMLYKDGLEVTNYSSYTFQWVRVLGTGDSNWGKSRTQQVTTADVNNALKLRCDVYEAGSLIASGFTEITDFSDPYYADFQITGCTGRSIRDGETAHLKPIARRRSDGWIDSSVTNWSFTITDNAGKPFILTGKNSATFTSASIDVSKADADRAGGSINGSVSTSY